MTRPPGHDCRTTGETEICEEMQRQGVPHAHRSLRFRVRESEGHEVPFEPAIVVHRGPVLFLVEPVSEPSRDDLARYSRFLEQHSPEFVFILLAPDELVPSIQVESYDEVYRASNVRHLVERIREQEPGGMVRPFQKVRETP